MCVCAMCLCVYVRFVFGVRGENKCLRPFAAVVVWRSALCVVVVCVRGVVLCGVVLFVCGVEVVWCHVCVWCMVVCVVYV